ncbi:MAG TPA: hypothetical protein VMH34_09980 [Gammaproteobacteria bacterium]|nr:hypothetical protein [Gammaproteobacteria bacterium]
MTVSPEPARACSSCGCSLNSDWSTQGYTGGTGLRFDFRYDFFNQNELRTGTGTVDRGSIVLPPDREIQQKTINRNYMFGLDYSPNPDWGVNLQVPYFDRFHTTIAEDDSDISTSDRAGIGDIRVIGRYQGPLAYGFGLQLGLKFPTGGFDQNFIAGPQAGNLLDRGLQLGTGSTDLIFGVYRFGEIAQDWNYFGQALFQIPVATQDDFRPGNGLNLNAGVRYGGIKYFAPLLQFNMRAEEAESGALADVDNSGAVLLNISPGISVPVTPKLHLYGFVQIPIYENVKGFQLEPDYTASVGLSYALW